MLGLSERLSNTHIRIVAAVNLLGTVFGFYYYREQLLATSVELWVFVPDSPISTLLMASSLVLLLRGKSSFLDGMAFIGNLKYGLWTVFILVFYSSTFLQINSIWMYLFLLFSHLLMALQAFLILELSDLKYAGIAVGWFLVNDFVDYFLDTHTFIYASHSHPFSPAMIAAFSLTVAGGLILNRYS